MSRTPWVVWPLIAMACEEPPTRSGVASQADEPGCVSRTQLEAGTAVSDITTWYRPDGLEERRTEENHAYGTWLGTVTIEHGYVGDQLVSITRWLEVEDLSDVPGATEELSTYAYDEQGRLVEEQVRVGGVLQRTTTHTHDALGQLVDTYWEMHDGQDDWRMLQTWEDGRLLRRETWNVDQNGLAFFEDHTYLAPAPSLDADIHSFVMGSERYVRVRYDGDRLVEEVLLDGPDAVWGYDTFQWVWRDDGQLSLLRSIGPDRRWLEAYSYDADGHLLSLSKGDDTDGDDVIDVLAFEQTWTWSCS
jgi:YD repeat-containing protein